MTLGRSLISFANRVLELIHLRLDSLTGQGRERARILAAINRGDFERPVYPIPASFDSGNYAQIFSVLPFYRDRFDTFEDKARNEVEFEYENGFFTSPDAEVLYTLVRQKKPQRIIEIGCGNSTKIIHQALLDGKFRCHLSCIDPQPRRDISRAADEIIQAAVESC